MSNGSNLEGEFWLLRRFTRLAALIGPFSGLLMAPVDENSSQRCERNDDGGQSLCIHSVGNQDNAATNCGETEQEREDLASRGSSRIPPDNNALEFLPMCLLPLSHRQDALGAVGDNIVV